LKNLFAKLGRVGPALGLLAVLAMGACLGAYAQDSDVTALVTAASSLWSTVKSLVIGIVGFSLLIFIAMKVRRR
jgi:hypothetical protein